MALSLNWKKLSKKIANDGKDPVKVYKPEVKKYEPKKNETKKREPKKFEPKGRGKKVREKHIKTALNNELIRSMEKTDPSGILNSTVPNSAGDGLVFYRALWNNEDITPKTNVRNTDTGITKSSRDSKKQELGRYLAIDCEFVGVGNSGKQSALARVSLINFYGHVVYDAYVKPKEYVSDWRTWVSGVEPAHMTNAVAFEEAQKKVSDLLNGIILVGHATSNDMKALQLSHPKPYLRDTALLPQFQEVSSGMPSLKRLVSHFLKIYDFQEGEHSSVEDARATMVLYRMYKADFERKFKTN